MKPITTSVYTFSNLRDGGFLYVDKTAGIHKLLQPMFAQYFLARPRRFGKSLLVSTLETIFTGRREYFKGLALDSLPYDWKVYPVIHLDLGSVQPHDAADLNDKLNRALARIAESLQIPALGGGDPSDRFTDLIHAAAKTSKYGKVVILIDEYDKPILGHLGSPDVTGIKNALKAFYSVIKTTEGLQRFALLTGVSKFSKVSVFSDLNNLTDLTMDARAATLLGYTKEEVARYFADRLPFLAKAVGKTPEETFADLETWYDGFRFEENSETVFNPVSVGKCFDTLKFKNYWFETGTPTFLIDLLKRHPVDLDNLTATEEDFGAYEPENPAMIPLLVQTGYMTIKGSSMFGEMSFYKLDFPNKEVERSFSQWLAQGFCGITGDGMPTILSRIADALRRSDVEALLAAFSLFFANIPYSITLQDEKYYQSIFYAVLKVIGAMVSAEVQTNDGRIDAVVETPKYVFVFEFKLRGTAESAIEQIRGKKYYEKFLGRLKKIALVGVEFDAKTRNLGKHIIEEL